MNKKILVGLMVTLLALIIISCGKKNNIKVAVEGAYPPFSKTEADGSVTGFDIDIANALCKQMEAECELVTQEWDGMIPGLVAKKYDAIIASMSITDERKEKVNFTQKYYSSTANFVGKKGMGLSITEDLEGNESALKGLKIGVQQATVSDNFVTDNYGKVAEIKRYGKQEEANLDLVSGRLDMIFVDTVPILDFLDSSDGSDFEIIGTAFADEKWFGEGIGIAIRKEDGELLEKFDQAIDDIRENGTYTDIQDNYFDFNIYGE